MSTTTRLLPTIAISFVLQAVPAVAQVSSQPAPGAGAAQAPSAGLTEVIVTAQRRQENVIDVPLSISATSGETLEATGIESFTDLRFNTPGFISNSGSGYTQLYLRGIGNRIEIGEDPSVSTFVDDTPRIFASVVDHLDDVERIEILKGAQGGLYGRNATAGVINIITRQPDPSAFVVDAQVEYGSYDTFKAHAYLNVPLNENTAFNLNVTRETHNAYIANDATLDPYASYAALSANAAAALGDTGQRAYLLANPNVVSALDSKSVVPPMDNEDYTYVDTKIRFRGDGFLITLAADWSNKNDSEGADWSSVATARTYGTYKAVMGGLGYSAAVLPFAYLYSGSVVGPFAADGPITTAVPLKDFGYSAKADIDIPDATLTSISSFRYNNSAFDGDVTASAVPSAGFYSAFQRENFYQELRAVSSGQGPFKWLGGATYYNEVIHNYLQTLLLGNGLSPTTALTGTNGVSAYLQGEYEFADRFKITASGRYVDERKTADFPAELVSIYNPATNVVTNGVPAAATSGKFEAKKFLPALTLSYGLEGGGTVYARWAQGMKTGGANPLVHPAQTDGVLNYLQPEQVNTYEVGLRTELLEHKIQFTSAIFDNEYTNLQVLKSGYTGLAAVYFNAGKARTNGAEAAVDWKAADIFTLSANVGYLDAKYTQFSSPGIPLLKVAAFNDTGNTMIMAPKWQGGITGDFHMPVSDRINAVATVLYSYISKFYTDDSDFSLTASPGYGLVNLRVGARTSDDHFGVYLRVNNVFDKEYIVFGSTAPSADSVIYGSPRIIMGEVQVKF